PKRRKGRTRTPGSTAGPSARGLVGRRGLFEVPGHRVPLALRAAHLDDVITAVDQRRQVADVQVAARAGPGELPLGHAPSADLDAFQSGRGGPAGVAVRLELPLVVPLIGHGVAAVLGRAVPAGHDDELEVALGVDDLAAAVLPGAGPALGHGDPEALGVLAQGVAVGDLGAGGLGLSRGRRLLVAARAVVLAAALVVVLAGVLVGVRGP